MKDLLYFTVQEVIDFHDTLVAVYGGSAGLRDRGLLESALAQPYQEVFENEIYPDIFSKAAAYCYFLIKNHPFNDGNKRTGVHATITFLKLNGISFTKNFDDLYNLAIDVAASKIEFPEIVEFLKKHTVKHE